MSPAARRSATSWPLGTGCLAPSPSELSARFGCADAWYKPLPGGGAAIFANHAAGPQALSLARG